MNINLINDSSKNPFVQGSDNNRYRIPNTEIERSASQKSPEKSTDNLRSPTASSPFLNVTQAITRTMNHLNAEQKNFIMDHYVKTDSVNDHLGYYK